MDEQVLDVGIDASLAELRTASRVELGLRGRAGTWTLQNFNLGSATARLGQVPVGTGSLPITSAAHRLTIVDGRSEEVLDLEAYATEPSLYGSATAITRVAGSLPGIFAVTGRGVVTLMAIAVPENHVKAAKTASKAIGALLTAYPDVWIGDADAYAAALRQDVLRTLDLWPEPPGLRVDVAVAGPGIDGTVWGAAGGSFSMQANGTVLLVHHPDHEPVEIAVSRTGLLGGEA